MSINPRRILFEDEHLLAINKLPRELVVKGQGKVEKLPLLDFLRAEYPNLKPVHRLDYETSGIVLFAKDPKALQVFIETNFADVQKYYQALVAGRPTKEGVIQKPLPSRGGSMVEATTEYEVLRFFANSAYVEAKMHTGRYHQIRRHFAKIGHPLLLDQEYGLEKYNKVFYREFGYRYFFLHASRLVFIHPITNEMLDIKASLPSQFKKIIDILSSF